MTSTEARAVRNATHCASDSGPCLPSQHIVAVQTPEDLRQPGSCVSTEDTEYTVPHNRTEPTSRGFSTQEHSGSNVESSGVQCRTSESTRLLGDKDTEVYTRRWYVLAVFSLSAAIQGGGWATWGPITQSCKAVFAWSDAKVALQPLWGDLAAMVTLVPATWLMDVKGQSHFVTYVSQKMLTVTHIFINIFPMILLTDVKG